MAATLTTTRTLPSPSPEYIGSPGRTISLYTLVWVSHTDGSVALATSVPIVGEILRVAFKPNAAGTQPTDNYDVTLTDTLGVDILAGQGANLSNATATHVCPGVPLKDGTTTSTRPPVVAEALTLNITNAGSGKGGTITLYVR